MPAGNSTNLQTEELAAIIREVRERVRARYPAPTPNFHPDAHIVAPIADLAPLVEARNSAETKVASIGTVNPRPGGAINSLIQACKRIIARGLDWFIRDQVVFNREAMSCVNNTIEALNDVNRALASLAAQTGAKLDVLHAGADALRPDITPLRQEAQELKEMRSHWSQWRLEWEHKLATNEIQFLRNVADLQGAFQHRATLMESNFREIVKSQHADYLGALDRATVEIQSKLWADMEKIRADYERLIHIELRLIRQRLQTSGAPAIPAESAPPAVPALDYARFADRFRGSEEHVKEQQKFYVNYFKGQQQVLDIGCGRGEFLELMRKAGVEARGIDLSPESVEACRAKGLQAETADLFAYLEAQPEATFDGIFCAQVVEHLAPARIPEFVRLAASRLVRGGVLAIETPNPECLAIFSTYFYLDPTHTRPVPHPLLEFYMQEFGVGHTEVHRRSPAIESIPALTDLPESVRTALFGGLDYAIIGRKLN
ncbi:MAG: methyltransferase domain-containing protein [Candidatus Solibacter usitatus]|nr:methyltransferase domain-containing protein [Candidatus Solibacter usitatus]